jgi:hypothetical protein
MKIGDDDRTVRGRITETETKNLPPRARIALRAAGRA